MRILHTSDWHLGRALASERLLSDQEYVLAQIVDTVREWKPDVIAISGDVYDRPIPPPDAVELLDDVLTRMILDTKCHVVLIAGNHDNPQRLTFGARLLELNRLHMAGTFNGGNRLALGDQWGAVDVFALPYLDPATVRAELGSEEIVDHESAAREMVNRIRQAELAPRSVLLAHAFVAGAACSESERPLAIGAAGAVSAGCFEGFSYVALGHLHKAQSAGPESIQYSGSILKYSFSEENHVKCVNLIELDATGECKIERIELTPRREVRTITGKFADLHRPQSGNGRNDLIRVQLLDERPVLDPLARLREIYPNVLAVEQNHVQPATGITPSAGERTIPVPELFADFFHQVTGDELAEDEERELRSILEVLAREERAQ